MESSFPLLEEITVLNSLHFWGCYTLFYVIIPNNQKDRKYHEEGRMQERGQGEMEWGGAILNTFLGGHH